MSNTTQCLIAMAMFSPFLVQTRVESLFHCYRREDVLPPRRQDVRFGRCRMRTPSLYTIWYVDTCGSSWKGTTYYRNHRNAIRTAKRYLGMKWSHRSDATIARATIYRDEIPVSIFGDGRVQPVS